jgi:hypothetical protein
VVILLVVIGGYYINGYGGYSINGYWWLFYQWILMIFLLMTIGTYSICGY